RFLYKYHEEPAWYFVAVLLIGCLPWSLLLPPLLRFVFTRSPEVRLLRSQAQGFLLLWAAWGFLFFSLSSGKLPPYILPTLPSLAMLVGSYLDAVLFHAPLTEFFQRARNAVPRQVVVVLCSAWLVVSLGAAYLHLIGMVEALVQVGLSAVCLAGLALWGR